MVKVKVNSGSPKKELLKKYENSLIYRPLNMGTQTTNVPDWQLPNSKKGHFWRENGCKTCNCGQNSTKLSEKLIRTKKLKVKEFETKRIHFSSFYRKIGQGGVFKTPL